MYFHQVWGKTEVNTESRWGYLNGRSKLEGVAVNGRTRTRILEKRGGMGWIGYIWLKIWTTLANIIMKLRVL